MKNILKKYRGFIMILFNVIIISFYYISIEVMYNNYLGDNFILAKNNYFHIVFIFVFMAIVLLLSKIFGGYRVGHYRIQEIIYFHTLSVLLSDIFISLILIILAVELKNLLAILVLMIIQFAFIVGWAYISSKIYFRLNRPVKIVLLHGRNPRLLIEKLIKRSDKYNLMKTISDDTIFEDILEDLNRFDGILVYEIDTYLKSEIEKYCFEKNKLFYMVPNISDVLVCNTQKIDLFDTPIFVIENKGLSFEQKILKRLLDLMIIIPALIVALPFMLLTAFAIKLNDGGPVLYKQKRLTLNGKEFYVYKFRSMKVDAEKNGARLASKNDTRITKVGKVIRAIRFDELPQIFNILKGDMSVVGPRPERPEIASTYMQIFPEFNYRLKVKAGLTGYAQVLGKYNTSPIDKVKLDLIYIQNYSLFLDFKLILMTVKILFMSESTEGIEEGKTLASDILEN